MKSDLLYRTYVAELAHGRGAYARAARRHNISPEWCRQLVKRHEANRPIPVTPASHYVTLPVQHWQACKAPQYDPLLIALLLSPPLYRGTARRDDELLALVLICLTTFCALMVAWRMLLVWPAGAGLLFAATAWAWLALLSTRR